MIRRPPRSKRFPYTTVVRSNQQGLVIIGVAMDYDPESQVREMVRQKKMNYPIVLDSNGKLAQVFGNVTLTPTTFFISKQGTIFKHKLGEMSHSELETAIQGMIL